MSLTLTRPPSMPLPTLALTAASVPAGESLEKALPAAPALPARVRLDIVDEWGMQSFPASDPPSNW